MPDRVGVNANLPAAGAESAEKGFSQETAASKNNGGCRVRLVCSW